MTLAFPDNETIEKATARIPKYVYKYHKLDINLIEMLTNAEFYMASRYELNDPLDSTYTMSLEDYLSLYYEKYPSSKEDKDQEWRVKFLYNWYLETGSNEWIKDIDELQSKLRISCFTEDGNNPLMWSHYGGNHAGVCLRFELSKDPEVFKQLVPIEYRDELIKASCSSDFVKSLLIKLKAWEIEKEWRLFSEETKLPFKQKALVEIICGLKMSDSAIRWFNQFSENVYYGHAIISKLRIRGNRLIKLNRYDEEVQSLV